MSKNLIFRMTEGRTPIAWQLPLSGLMLPRIDEKSGQAVDKLIHYLPGAPSIFMEDYKGDKKGQDIWLEDGVIEVRPSDVLKIEILKKHPWFNIHYELVDDDANAEKELHGFELQDKASSLVEESDPMKLKAIALVFFRDQVFTWSELKCKAELKKKAFTEPKTIIDEFNKDNFESRFIVGLSLLKEIIKTDRTHTSVIWANTGETLIRLAVGENAIDKLSDFLSVNSEEAIITLQRLGELAEGKTETKSIVTAPATNIPAADNSAQLLADKDDLLSDKDAEIKELKAQLAASKQPQTGEKFTDSKEGSEDASSGKLPENELENTEKEEPKVLTLLELQDKYFDLTKVIVPLRYKNDPKWILLKIQELEAAK